MVPLASRSSPGQERGAHRMPGAAPRAHTVCPALAKGIAGQFEVVREEQLREQAVCFHARPSCSAIASLEQTSCSTLATSQQT